MKLSKIPACFDLTEMKKGYFPHLFNKKENKHYVGSYPDHKYYGVDYMSSKENGVRKMVLVEEKRGL